MDRNRDCERCGWPGGHSVNSHRERIWFSPNCLKPVVAHVTAKQEKMALIG